jgi:CBS domain-containing protein
MKIPQAMTRNVVAVPPETRLSRAADLMTRSHIRHLPVVHDGQLLGILSDRDVLKYETVRGDDIQVGVAMTAAPITCTATDTVSHAASLMLEHKIDCVPVVDAAGSLVGIVTSFDLLLLLVWQAEDERLPFTQAVRVLGDRDLLVDAELLGDGELLDEVS